MTYLTWGGKESEEDKGLEILKGAWRTGLFTFALIGLAINPLVSLGMGIGMAMRETAANPKRQD